MMANSSMASQITGAYVYHINTATNISYKKYNYSDHDACLVGLCLGAGGCDSEAVEYRFADGKRAKKTIENGRLVLTLPDGATYNVIGLRIR